MNYNIEEIEKRNRKIIKFKKIVKRTFFTLLIILLYNVFLITKTTLDNKETKGILGYKAYIITTDSMKPTIKTGDIVIVKNTEEEKIKVEDIITFKRDENIVTHRLVDIQETEQGKKYITKGDNNNVNDYKEVLYSEIEGVKVLVIPRVGNLILLLEDNVYIILIINLILIIYVNTKRVEEKRRMRRERKKIEDQKVK